MPVVDGVHPAGVLRDESSNLALHELQEQRDHGLTTQLYAQIRPAALKQALPLP